MHKKTPSTHNLLLTWHDTAITGRNLVETANWVSAFGWYSPRRRSPLLSISGTPFRQTVLLYRFALGNPSWGLGGCLSMYLYVRHQYTDANYINIIEIILICHVSKCRYLYAIVLYPFVCKIIFHTIFTKANNALEVLVAFSRVKITFQFLFSVCNCVNNCTQKSQKFGIQYIFVNKCNGHTQSYIIRLMLKLAEHNTLISHLNAQGSVHSSNTYIMENMEAIVMRVLL